MILRESKNKRVKLSAIRLEDGTPIYYVFTKERGNRKFYIEYQANNEFTKLEKQLDVE